MQRFRILATLRLTGLQAERLRPDMAEPERALAADALRLGSVALLADSSEELIRIEPHSAEGYLYHANALLAREDAAGAEKDFDEAIKLAPQDPAPYTRLGDLRAAQQRFSEAKKFYGRGLALNPSAADGLAGLVNIDLTRKQPAQALRLAQDQIARVPNSSYRHIG